jgi:hypothetical protein
VTASGAVSPLLQVIITAIGTGGMFGMFTITQTRRKLKAETDKAGVDATAVLTGEALDMVKEVRDQAREAREQANAAKAEMRELHREADDMRRHLRAVERHVIRLEQLVRQLGGLPPKFTWPPGQDFSESGV